MKDTRSRFPQGLSKGIVLMEFDTPRECTSGLGRVLCPRQLLSGKASYLKNVNMTSSSCGADTRHRKGVKDLGRIRDGWAFLCFHFDLGNPDRKASPPLRIEQIRRTRP
ncbi:putative Atp-Dependent Rna Helicase Ddx17 [Manis pentadactyla]|nr:putative Atp-Dependent Rna Helicase Ddx17 [Manis pentadactyla]